MIRILLVLLAFVVGTSALAINDTKLPRKCRKHPEKCQLVQLEESNLTLGVVQKDIKVGTSQADVASILGSPNIVTMDADGKETWIYDKMSSITTYNSSGFGVNIGGLGGGYGSNGFGGGIAGVGYGKNGSSVNTTQRTLTVVLKFDSNHHVSNFSYHMSSF